MDKQKWIYFILLLVAVVFIYRVRAILPPFLFAAIIAYAAYPLVTLFEKRQMPRYMAIVLVYLIFGVIACVGIAFLVPQLAQELDELLLVLPERTDRLENLGSDVLRSWQRINIPTIIQQGLDTILNKVQQLLENLASRVADLLVGLVSQVASLVIAPFLAFYILRDHKALKRRFFVQIPRRYRRTVYTLAQEFNNVFNGFIRGQLLNSLFVGILIALGLWIIGLKYALFIGIIAGLFNIIPYFGPVIGVFPAIALALAKSPMTVVWVIVIFIVVNQIEASIISPKIVGERVGLHPLAIIFAVLAGGEVMGLMGMLLAVPVAAIIRVIIGYLVKKMDRSFV